MKYGFSQKLFGYFYLSSCMKEAKKQKLDLDKMSIIAFLGMLFVKGVRLGTIFFGGIAGGSELRPYYIDLLISSIEYIIVSIILQD